MLFKKIIHKNMLYLTFTSTIKVSYSLKDIYTTMIYYYGSLITSYEI